MAQDAFCVGDNAGFNLAEMGSDLGSGPGDVRGAGLPVCQRDGVGGGKVDGLGAEEVGANGVEIRHECSDARLGEAKVDVPACGRRALGGFRPFRMTNS